MIERLRVVSEPQLTQLTNLIHDYWFDVEQVLHDQERSVLSVKFIRPASLAPEVLRTFLFIRQVREVLVEWYLKIHQVESYRIEDARRIGEYDFNEVRYLASERRLVFVTGIPTTFEVIVRGLEITVDETDRVVRQVTRLTM